MMAIVIYNSAPQDWRPDSELSPEELKKRQKIVARFLPPSPAKAPETKRLKTEDPLPGVGCRMEEQERKLMDLVDQTINQKPYPVQNVDGLVIAGAVSPSGKMTVVFMMVLEQTPALLKQYPETPEAGMVLTAIGMTPAEVSALVATLVAMPGVELPKTEDSLG